MAEHKPSNPMDVYDEFFSLAYRAGAVDVKTKHLVAHKMRLMAEKGPKPTLEQVKEEAIEPEVAQNGVNAETDC